MREALLMNLKGFSASQLKQTIDDGIASKEETILVGLGVLKCNSCKVFQNYFRPDSGLFFL